MNIITINKLVMLRDDIGRHTINCSSVSEAEKLGRRLRTDPDFANKMLRLCRPLADEHPIAIRS